MSTGLEDICKADVIVSGLMNFFSNCFWTKQFEKEAMKQSCKTINLILSEHVKQYCSYYNILYDLSVTLCQVAMNNQDNTKVLLECGYLYDY